MHTQNMYDIGNILFNHQEQEKNTSGVESIYHIALVETLRENNMDDPAKLFIIDVDSSTGEISHTVKVLTEKVERHHGSLMRLTGNVPFGYFYGKAPYMGKLNEKLASSLLSESQQKKMLKMTEELEHITTPTLTEEETEAFWQWMAPLQDSQTRASLQDYLDNTIKENKNPKKGEHRFAITLNGKSPVEFSFYRHYAVWYFFAKDMKLSEQLCGCCGEEKLTSYKYTSAFPDLKMFTSTNKANASGGKDFDIRHVLCPDCAIRVVTFLRNMKHYGQRMTVSKTNMDITVYPKFLFPEDISFQELETIRKIVADTFTLFDSFKLEGIRELRQLEDTLEGNKAFTLDLLVTERQKSSTITHLIVNDIPAARLLKILSTARETNESLEGLMPSENLPASYFQALKDITLYDNYYFLEKARETEGYRYNEYRQVFKTILSGKYHIERETVLRRIARRLRTGNIKATTKSKRYELFRENILPLYGILVFLEKLKAVEPITKGENDVIYDLLEEHKENSFDVSNLHRMAKETNIQDNDRLTMAILGYLASRLDYKQEQNGNRGILKSLVNPGISMESAQRLAATIAPKLEYYFNGDIYAAWLMRLMMPSLNRGDMSISDSERSLAFYMGVSQQRTHLPAKKEKNPTTTKDEGAIIE